MAARSPAPVPFPTLLSQLLVAFTIEFDNEFEHRMAHWTTDAGRAAGPKGAPWLVSQVMWANVMQYLDGGGIRVGELHARSRTTADSLAGLERWSYVVVTPAAVPDGTGAADGAGAASGAGHTRGASRDHISVRPTVAGQEARAIWGPLAAEVEARWVLRFGREAIDSLRQALEEVRAQFDDELPQYLPIVHPAQNGKVAPSLVSERAGRSMPANPSDGAGAVGGAGPAKVPPPDLSVDLSVLLAQVLLRFALDYEAEARVSLTIAANTLRVLDGTGVAVRELPRLTGVSKEANSVALGFLARRECAVIEPDPSARRGKRVRLTPRGQTSQDEYHRLLAETQERWKDRFGADTITLVRRSLLGLVGERIPLKESVLAEGLTPYADGWRAATKPAETLPHYPMVLHRGGYPDGS